MNHTLVRECQATAIPAGTSVVLPAGTEVYVTQSLGGSITVRTDHGLLRIAAEDADALGGYAAQAEPTVGAGEFSEAAVWAALRSCFDPEIPVNIVDLGLVYDMAVEKSGTEHTVDVKMTLTAQGCGMGPTIAEDARRKIAALPNVAAAKDARMKPICEADRPIFAP